MKRLLLWLSAGLLIGALLVPVTTSRCSYGYDLLAGHAVDKCEGYKRPLLLALFGW